MTWVERTKPCMSIALGPRILNSVIPELVHPGENGWLSPAGAVDELAAAMADRLVQPMEVLRRMGEATRRRVLERHDIDAAAAAMARYFEASA